MIESAPIVTKINLNVNPQSGSTEKTMGFAMFSGVSVYLIFVDNLVWLLALLQSGGV